MSTTRITIAYVHSLAFTKCECGADLVLALNVYGDPIYRGSCECGKRWELFKNVMKEGGPQ